MKRVFLDTNILIDYIDNRVGADDAEQMLQYQCAKAASCDYIVTNDRRHYDFSDIPHFTSADFVDQLDDLIK